MLNDRRFFIVTYPIPSITYDHKMKEDDLAKNFCPKLKKEPAHTQELVLFDHYLGSTINLMAVRSSPSI